MNLNNLNQKGHDDDDINSNDANDAERTNENDAMAHNNNEVVARSMMEDQYENAEDEDDKKKGGIAMKDNDEDRTNDDDRSVVHRTNKFTDADVDAAAISAVASLPADLHYSKRLDNSPNTELVNQLIDEIQAIAMTSGNYNSNNSNRNNNDTATNNSNHPTHGVTINFEKARNILEATAGDVISAASLYWDDYLATLQQQEQRQHQQPPEQEQELMNDNIHPIQQQQQQQQQLVEQQPGVRRTARSKLDAISGMFAQYLKYKNESANMEEEEDEDGKNRRRKNLESLQFPYQQQKRENDDEDTARLFFGPNVQQQPPPLPNELDTTNNDEPIDPPAPRVRFEPVDTDALSQHRDADRRHAVLGGETRSTTGKTLTNPYYMHNKNRDTSSTTQQLTAVSRFHLQRQIEEKLGNGQPPPPNHLELKRLLLELQQGGRKRRSFRNADIAPPAAAAAAEVALQPPSNNVFKIKDTSFHDGEVERYDNNNFNEGRSNELRPQQKPPPPVPAVDRQRHDDFLRFLLSRNDRNENAALSDDDDDDGDEIIVRHHGGNNNHNHRLLQYLKDSGGNSSIKDDPIVEPISVKRRKLMLLSKSKVASNGKEEEDEDDYISDNDWMWESLANTSITNLSALTELSPISLPMDLLWGGSYSIAMTGGGNNNNSTATATEATTAAGPVKDGTVNAPKIIETKITDEHGRTKTVVKMNSQYVKERLQGKLLVELKAVPATKKLSPSAVAEPSSSSKVQPVLESVIEKKRVNDDDHDDDNVGDDKVSDHGNIDDVVAGIPRTWMSAGFHLVKSTLISETNNAHKITSGPTNPSKIVGLAVLPPNENDFAYNMWKNQQTDSEARHATIPLPYHCRSITALLSIVTGLMYTGATVQVGGQVSCCSSRQPLQELIGEENVKSNKNPKVKLSKGELMYQEQSESDRLGREYNSRLVDALTTLLHIAAQTSMQRKTKALQILQTSKDPADQRRWLLIKRKLRLVPTCWWEVSPSEMRLSHTEMPKDDMCCLPLVVSYTNIDDLRSYVQGNIRAFTSTGGCALFLETIARIHGKGALSHMIRRSRKAAGYTGSDVSKPLLCCTCNQRHFQALDDDPNLTKSLKAQSKKGIQYDTSPQGHGCFSVELLSLLLVGNIHSTFQGWSTAPLGLGVLSNTMNEVGRGLTRPEKPVWILRGPKCYSVMWLNGCSNCVNNFAAKDHSGDVATLTHWNCWDGKQNATQFRLVTDRSNSVVPEPALNLYNDESGDGNVEFSSLTNVTLQIARRRHLKESLDRECKRIEIIDPSLFVSNEEMQGVTVHPDDPNYYPNLYRMWRYDLSDIDDKKNDNDKVDDAKDLKQHIPTWKSYHTLNDHDKHIIETKLGPQICTVLWTRWPRSTVDRFVPNDALPIV